jgi:SAM-dependent methyltransferase
MSWSQDDHLRHFGYQGIGRALTAWASVRDARDASAWRTPIDVLDFGSEWYGDDTGQGWATYMRGMLKKLVSGVAHTLATYPPHDVQRMPEFADASFDVAVVDNVLEHVARPWLAAVELRRVLRPGGVCVAMTPGLYPIHLSPLDCWRILPDGYRALFPASEWETLTCDMWGSLDRLIYELKYNGAFPDGPPETTVAHEVAMSGQLASTPSAPASGTYVEGCDGRFPIMIWWVGIKR